MSEVEQQKIPLREIIEQADKLTAGGNWVAASDFLESALSDHENNIAILDRLAVSFMRRQENTRALHVWNTILSLAPSQPRARLNLIDLLLREGDLQQADKVADDGLKLLPDNEWMLIKRAQVNDALLLEDRQVALSSWKAAVQRAPNNKAAVIGLAACLQSMDEVQEAEKTLLTAKRSLDGEQELALALVRLYGEYYLLDAAIAVGREFIMARPSAPAVVPLVVKYLLCLHRYDELSDLLASEAAKALPNYQILLSRAAASRKLWEDACAGWKQQAAEIQEGPRSRVEKVDLVYSIMKKKDFVTAQAGALELLSHYPEEVASFRVCSNVFRAAGSDFATGGFYFVRLAADRFPEDVESCLQAAAAYFRPGRNKIAEGYLNKVVDTAPNRWAAEAASLLLGIHTVRNDVEAAQKLLASITGAAEEKYNDSFSQLCRIHLRNADLLRGVESETRTSSAGFPAVAELETLVRKAAVWSAKRGSGNARGARVAICVSGQLRGYETAWPLLRKLIIDPLQADVFLSTWNTVGTGAGGPGVIDRFIPPILLQALPLEMRKYERFLDACPNASDLILKDESVAADVLSGSLGLAGCETEPPENFDEHWKTLDVPDRMKNACRMIYKIWRAHELMRKQEHMQGWDYDIVLRLRPDMLFSYFDLSQVRNVSRLNNTLCVKMLKASGLEDQFAVGGRGAMEIYSSIWPMVKQRGNSGYLPWFAGAWSEGLLRNHVFASGLTYKECPAMRWSLCQRVPRWDRMVGAFLDDAENLGEGGASIVEGVKLYLRDLERSADVRDSEGMRNLRMRLAA
ncbi:tetratricopeptide repeat protein [Roseomonas elaeocarpi]|uniref:Tetratricopeptide repeat protein n=1 Tax=Roseomonas elaeocarpi TaxID=907779 RepID=A0ABV6JNV8_9PROT